jgi:hypothetical protein
MTVAGRDGVIVAREGRRREAGRKACAKAGALQGVGTLDCFAAARNDGRSAGALLPSFVIARSGATKQSSRYGQGWCKEEAHWIASLALAMTRENAAMTGEEVRRSASPPVIARSGATRQPSRYGGRCCKEEVRWIASLPLAMTRENVAMWGEEARWIAPQSLATAGKGGCVVAFFRHCEEWSDAAIQQVWWKVLQRGSTLDCFAGARNDEGERRDDGGRGTLDCFAAACHCEKRSDAAIATTG